MFGAVYVPGYVLRNVQTDLEEEQREMRERGREAVTRTQRRTPRALLESRVAETPYTPTVLETGMLA